MNALSLKSWVLLFAAGLETDLEKFLRYSWPGLGTAIGGAVVPFAVGDALVVWFGYAENYSSPVALMMGTVAMATSVGITTAVLSERRRLDSPEGVTILSAAVIDDILGLVHEFYGKIKVIICKFHPGIIWQRNRFVDVYALATDLSDKIFKYGEHTLYLFPIL